MQNFRYVFFFLHFYQNSGNYDSNPCWCIGIACMLSIVLTHTFFHGAESFDFLSSKLLNDSTFHTSLLACALEVVMATYGGMSYNFLINE